MNIWWIYTIIATLTAFTIAFIWLAYKLNEIQKNQKKSPKNQLLETLGKSPEVDVEHIFNKEFREELRNRGRLHFEKIIGENAMFLQQDLRLTTSQLNEFMKSEISTTLKDEFSKYEQSIGDAKQMAIESIQKTLDALENQRKTITEEVKKELEGEREKLINNLEQNMTDIVSHYLVEAIGDQIDLEDQLDYILGELDQNKKEIIEDLKHGI